MMDFAQSAAVFEQKQFSMEAITTTASQLPSFIIRGLFGGLLMGLANLVPGISGGTMLLAAGIYPFFIAAIAEVSTLKFRTVSLAILGSVVVAAGFAILFLAGWVKQMVVDHRWVMYSLFIGLTLGGLPVVWKITRPATPGTWVAAGVGFLAMAALALLQQAGATASGEGAAGMVLLFVAGLAGASAMILPGISGGYLLLVLGQYVPILTAIDRFKDALQAADWAAAFDVGLKVLTPVGLGVVIGIVAVSNLLKYLLRRFEKPTLGVLLGLLLGAVVGLWPFQEGIPPQVGDQIKGRPVTEERLAKMDPGDYPTRFFRPTAGQAGTAAGGILIGFLVTVAIARFEPKPAGPAPAA
jgi:putative membrane protein